MNPRRLLTLFFFCSVWLCTTACDSPCEKEAEEYCVQSEACIDSSFYPRKIVDMTLTACVGCMKKEVYRCEARQKK